jgi:hypothetical protein
VLLRDIVCLRNICVNTLHKGDSDDDDDDNNNNSNFKNEKTCTLIDVAMPADRNVVQNEVEKMLKKKKV